MANFNPPNKYNNTPRKVFDKHVDRMETRRLRDKEDHRADFKALLRRLTNLETQLTLIADDYEELRDHVQRHCAELDTSRDDTRDS